MPWCAALGGGLCGHTNSEMLPRVKRPYDDSSRSQVNSTAGLASLLKICRFGQMPESQAAVRGRAYTNVHDLHGGGGWGCREGERAVKELQGVPSVAVKVVVTE